MIEGPISGGQHGWAFGCPLADLAARGYVVEEFFLGGLATTWRQVPGSPWERDGRWQAEASGEVPFRTRILVYRPADPARFNGTAVVCWNNVTAGYELFAGDSPEILEGGYAFVAASVQRVGIHGFPTNSQGLAAWDPARYGTLDIPTDDASYDIFTQVARAVGPRRNRAGVDPLAGLPVQRVIGLGASQSAGRLATYLNAIHARARAFDGFMLQIWFGRGTPLEVGPAIVNVDMARQLTSTDPAVLLREAGLLGDCLLRDDLDVPVMVVNSELEAIACQGVRQPDTARLRTWECAGTSHGSHPVAVQRAAKYAREFGQSLPVLEGMNRVSIVPVYDAALHHLDAWLRDGTPPPSQPRIAFAGEPATIVRDADGIAVGGIRLPQVEVPVAAHGAKALRPDVMHLLRGASPLLDAALLRARHGDEATYLARFGAAAERAVAAGVLLPRDAGPACEEAAREFRRALG